MATCEKKNLTSHDKAVLNKIFNPNLPFNDVLDEDDTADSDAGSVPLCKLCKEIY